VQDLVRQRAEERWDVVIPGRGLAREPETMNTALRNQGLGRCSWVPGSALKGRPGTTAEFFRSLLESPSYRRRVE
jgi:hypothetical protein